MSSLSSQLECLSVRGIRSFGDEGAELITFSKPLTVIVGANGCGKTTLIEALKYACTGELPPGTAAGQSFVHDPKIAGKSEVKGQIKLKFKNRLGQTMVCVRDLQLTQARSKMTFKALDSVIMTYKWSADMVRARRAHRRSGFIVECCASPPRAACCHPHPPHTHTHTRARRAPRRRSPSRTAAARWTS